MTIPPGSPGAPSPPTAAARVEHDRLDMAKALTAAATASADPLRSIDPLAAPLRRSPCILMNDISTMKVLCCPTAFKGTLSAVEAADAMARGAEHIVGPGSAMRLPLSDGGPGLLDALLPGTPAHARLWSVEIAGPLGAPASVRVLQQDREAVIESADAVGLHLVPAGELNPLRASSRGLGQAMAAALERGARRLIVGLGGSATVDGGTGMAKEFGYRFVDSRERELPEGGGALIGLAAIRPGSIPDAEVIALVDVRSPLCGPDGAAYRFAAQKGATIEEMEHLEVALSRLAQVIERDLSAPVNTVEGAGAAGGLGAGCVAFLGASLRPGAEWVMERVGFDRALAACDLVITGEGAWDATSALGKITDEVLRRSRAAGKPVLLACGRVEGMRRTPGLIAVDGGGARLDSDGLARLVARALREHPDPLQGSRGPA